MTDWFVTDIGVVWRLPLCARKARSANCGALVLEVAVVVEWGGGGVGVGAGGTCFVVGGHLGERHQGVGEVGGGGRCVCWGDHLKNKNTFINIYISYNSYH